MLKSSTILYAKHTAKSTAFILVFIYAFSYVGTPKENGLRIAPSLLNTGILYIIIDFIQPVLFNNLH